MPFADLRDFLAELEKHEELVRVGAPVDVHHEVGAICRKVSDAHGPALLFERPRGYSTPVAVNLLGTRRRLALALECDADALCHVWKERTREPVEPLLVTTGPCKEHVLRGSEVDLGRFPVPTWNHLDGGPYIDLPCIISKDPETGIRNAAMYRLQVQGKRSLGILAASYRHLAMQRKKTKGPFPVAIALGLDPSILLAAIGPFPFGVDELAMAGALRGEAIQLVPCETIPLEVPASAEIVIEGEMHPGETAEEGPFGEFTGFYGPRGQRPVIRINAITFRDEPVYQGAYCGKPPQETNLIYSFSIAAEITRSVPIPGLKQVNVAQSGFNAIISTEKPCEGYGKMMGLAVLGTWAGRLLKTVIVVDEDIDPFNWDEVEWALATRVQPHRDVSIINELVGITLDPSLPAAERTDTARTSKMIIDATKYDAERYEPYCAPNPEMLARVESRWEEYGIPLGQAVHDRMSARIA